MDKFVSNGKNDDRLIQKMIRELEEETPVKKRSVRPNTAFLNRLLQNTTRQNTKDTKSLQNEDKKEVKSDRKEKKTDLKVTKPSKNKSKRKNNKTTG
ncbi:hypothetical protein BN7_3052 [Wickerhamomyces ciferrii]|uniref:Uncharacterized protein n=1 Tax=Wickerhamomyces ciferrii (strain ATCC 14091 / BCRC 22168 / CBS 111 / JCM 3599 / NBRC 0793 / NRRL Y-1031 F-60-10) TaxID=1206466 RepID=K0KMR4_WICCF|nr:uncharacterized protein BN7_3052 [Wickerhamomyces ciferrii]CCH43502.1 hypothetical protein BN7_3052 [Wickerhamomyces ciferrii]